VLGPDVLDELGAVHAVVQEELLDATLGDPGARDGRPVHGIAHQVERIRRPLEGLRDLRLVGGLARVVGRHRDEGAAERRVRLGELPDHVDAEVVVDVDHRQASEAQIQRVLRGGHALEGIGRDRAEEPPAALPLPPEVREGRG
jgi:hypothetical protein